MDEIQNIKKGKYSPYYVDLNKKQLNELIKQINNFKDHYKVLSDFINKFSEYENNLVVSIKILQSWLDSIEKLSVQDEIESCIKDHFNTFLKNFNEYQEKIQIIIKKLVELETIKNNIVDEKEKCSLTINFNPPKIGNLSSFSNNEIESNIEDSNNSFLNKTPTFIQSLMKNEKSNEANNKKEPIELNEEQTEYLICRECKENAEFIYKNKYYCKKCSNNILDFSLVQIIHYNKTNTAKIYEFLNSVSICIKLILLKSNYLISLGNIEALQSKQGSKIMPIKWSKDINYPFIKDHDNVNYIDFLKDIDKALDEECKFTYDTFLISNLDGRLLETLKYIFYDESNTIYNEAFRHIEDQYSSEDFESKIFYINQIEMDNNYINYISPKRLYHYYNNYKNKIEQNFKKKTINLNDKLIIKNGSNQKKVNKREKLSYEQFFYLIEYLYDNTDKNNKEKEFEIIRKMKNFLIYERNNNIMKYLFNDFLITTESILKLSIDEIIINFPTLNELYEYKILVDGLISKELGLKDYIDYRHNFINAPKNCLKVKGIKMNIFIPFGWLGIGMKYETIKDDQWVDAILGIGENLSPNEVREILEKNIINGLIKEKNQDEKNNKSIESKAYFSTQIKTIEAHSGSISFYGSKYRIAFMVKIKKSMLKNVDNINLCNLSKENIKIQTILLKKIIY